MKKSKTAKPVIILICLYLIVPLALTFLYSVFAEWNEVLPRGLTFSYYGQILFDPDFWTSILRSIIISVLPIFVSTLAVLLAMYVVVVYVPRADKYMQIICTIPYAVQGIVLAISVLALYADAPGFLSNRILMLTATYSVVVLPYIYQGIRNSLNAVNASRLIEAAQMLGAGKLYSFFRVVVPNIFSGITISAMLAMSIIFGDFVVINIVGGNYFETAQIYMYRAMFMSGQLTSAIIVILFLVTLAISLFVFFYRNKNDLQEE
jgi:putative spermidine/putrescine transport system permease protein